MMSRQKVAIHTRIRLRYSGSKMINKCLGISVTFDVWLVKEE